MQQQMQQQQQPVEGRDGLVETGETEEMAAGWKGRQLLLLQQQLTADDADLLPQIHAQHNSSSRSPTSYLPPAAAVAAVAAAVIGSA